MNRIVLDDVFKELGISGVRKLVIALTGPHNNREVAEDFNLKLYQVRVLNQFLPLLCGELLKRENEGRPQAVVLEFNNKLVA